MAEMLEPLPSSSDSPIVSDCKDDDEPSPKKRKTSVDTELIDKLEHRLGSILCCVVCLDLPEAAVYQCSNGHLMCVSCFTHLLADARLRDDNATCPSCRVEISKTSATRNLAVEKAVSELPSECKHCTKAFPRRTLQHHEDKICEDRVTACRYECVGCPWRGAARAAAAHEAACALPRRPARDLLQLLARRERDHAEHLKHHTQLLDLLSYERITFNDLHLRPFRAEEPHGLYFETSRFSAFGHQWVVKAFVNRHQRDPTQSARREIAYQLILKSKPSSALCVRWVATRGPGGGPALRPCSSSHTFLDDEAAPARALPLAEPEDADRLLAAKAVHFRLIMFLSSK